MSKTDIGRKTVMVSEALANHSLYLFNTYFKHTDSSNLSIKLSENRTIYAHRIILMRGSAHFSSMLMEDFKVRIFHSSSHASY
jgi:hypothetical protein